MNKAFYVAGSGMRSFQKDLDIVSNNIANINTVGFKASKASFKELLVTHMDNNEAKAKNHKEGHGVDVTDVQVLMSQGQLVQTSSPSDYAIVGEGFFAVLRDDIKQYTRNGSFKTGLVGKKCYITTADGAFVLDDRGRKIELKKDDDGNIITKDNKEKIGVFSFANSEGLKPLGNTSFEETVLSGKAKAIDLKDSKTKIMQSALERAGVDLAEQMAEVITAQRAYSLNAKIIQTADQMEEMSNNLR